MHVHSTASQLSKLGVQRSLSRLAGWLAGGYRSALLRSGAPSRAQAA